MKQNALISARRVLAALAVLWCFTAGAGGSEAQTPGGRGGESAAIQDRSLRAYFKGGPYSSALVGRYADEATAKQAAARFQSLGLTSFVLKKEAEERRAFYLVLVGLFGRNRDAETLGGRLQAQGLVPAYLTVPVGQPAELTATAAQNAGLYAKLSDQVRRTESRASRPLSADSPAATGQAFKKRVYGSYVGSYRDPQEARLHAEKLAAGGWPASVQHEGSWHRVYLVPTQDTMNWRADSRTLEAAQRSAASQAGIFMLVDMSAIQGEINNPNPNPDRRDASACAGLSEAGRLGGSLRRTLIYIPDTSYTAALVDIGAQSESRLRDIPGRIKNWWDEKPEPQRPPLYGPAIFNRPEMDRAIAKLKPENRRISLALGLTETAGHLLRVPGRKIVLVFSEFQGEDKPADIKEAVRRLKSEFGSSLEMIFVYGDTDAAGYVLAGELAGLAGSGQAWDGCRLLNDNDYFERYIKTIFR